MEEEREDAKATCIGFIVGGVGLLFICIAVSAILVIVL